MSSNCCNESTNTASLIVLCINLMICCVQIVLLRQITMEFFTSNHSKLTILGPLTGNEKNFIFACIESFVLMATIVTIVKRKWFMITCVIVVLFVDTLITVCISICNLYRFFFRILWLAISDPSSENHESLLGFNYAFLIMFIILIYSVFEIYSIKILYNHKIFLQNESIESKSRRSDTYDYRDGTVTPPPPPYDFYTIESAMSGYSNAVI